MKGITTATRAELYQELVKLTGNERRVHAILNELEARMFAHGREEVLREIRELASDLKNDLIADVDSWAEKLST